MKHEKARLSDGAIREIAEDLYMITLPMPFRLGHVNVYALMEKGGVHLFDTGLNMKNSLALLDGALQSRGYSLGDVKNIFLTHFHSDHCSSAGPIKEVSGARIHMTEPGWRHIARMREPRLIAERVAAFTTRHGLPATTLAFIEKIFQRFRSITAYFDVDDMFSPPESLTIGGRTVETILTPGHANGHTCYVFPDDGIMLSGDHVLPDITPNLSIDLFDPEYRPLQSFLHSLRKVRDLPVSMVCPAHGSPFSDLKGRVDAIIAHHGERKGFVLESVRGGPKTTYQISQDVFDENLSEFDKYLALNETYVHLIELEKEGAVEKEEKGAQIVYKT